MENSNQRIIHLIFTRFLIEFYNQNGYPKKIYTKDYISNGIRVMKKYLIPSLENQSCKNFIWIIMLGDKANKTYVESLLKLNISFQFKVIFRKNIKKFVRNITKNIDFLITTRIDYDDGIYYDAVNDIRKEINNNKPLVLHGYNRGVYYFEFNNKYYDYYHDYHNDGVMSVFFSLITCLSKVNDAYTILDFGDHRYIRKKLLKNYKSYGIKNMNYEPAIFDSGDSKFIYVRQKYSGSYNLTGEIPKHLKLNNFNLKKFYGK